MLSLHFICLQISFMFKMSIHGDCRVDERHYILCPILICQLFPIQINHNKINANPK